MRKVSVGSLDAVGMQANDRSLKRERAGKLLNWVCAQLRRGRLQYKQLLTSRINNLTIRLLRQLLQGGENNKGRRAGLSALVLVVSAAACGVNTLIAQCRTAAGGGVHEALLVVAIALPFVNVPPMEIWPWIRFGQRSNCSIATADTGLSRWRSRVGLTLMRGLSPLVVLALTLIFAGEVLTTQQIFGIMLDSVRHVSAVAGRRWQTFTVVDVTGGSAGSGCASAKHLH